VRAWSGDIELPRQLSHKSGQPLDPISTADVYGLPTFRFEDVEVLGFRIDLGLSGRPFDRDLARLIEPLNFHLSTPAGQSPEDIGDIVPDFRYRAATGTLVIELLRYGRMTSRAPVPPLRLDDSQSQHELVVRLLVGRVDDDTAQAHAPAVYVPAIFVDNPWSKILGRTSLGFDKRLADFCVRQPGGYARLLPDGRVAGSGPATHADGAVPLGDISRISLVKTTGESSSTAVLDFEYASVNHTDPDAFLPVNLGLAVGTSLLNAVRWRRTDFEIPEFRRLFARLALAETVTAFRSVQVAPIVDRILDEPLDQTWVEGTFEVDDVRVALPLGEVTLTLHAIPSEGEGALASPTAVAWNLLCRMLGDGQRAQIALPTGTWYRLLCSMNLTIDDGLSWGD
jgi:hypothetical protein